MGKAKRNHSDIRIQVVARKNPKRAGAARRFAKYHNGMTPQQYADAIGDARQAYRDLTWDFEHGYIWLTTGDQDNKQEPAPKSSDPVEKVEKTGS